MALISFGFIPVVGFDASPCEVQLSASFTGSYSGDTFECYTENDFVVSLPVAGSGWDGVWLMGPNAYGIKSEDTMETYTSGSIIAGTDILNDGNEWSSSWYLADMEA